MNINALIALLSPCLPFLLKVGEQASEGAVNKLGSDTWDKAKAIWAKLFPKIEAKPSAKEAVEDLAASPDDEGLQAALRVQLKKLLTNDEALTQEILKIMEGEKSSATSNVTHIEQQGDVSQSAGDNAKQIGKIGSARDISL